MRSQVCRHVDTVQFVILSLGQTLVSVVLYHHVAGRTSAVSTAGVLQVNAKIKRDVEQGFGLAVTLVGQFAALELHRLIERKKGHLGHTLIIAVPESCAQMPLFSINIM